jgi:hypothetical protein
MGAKQVDEHTAMRWMQMLCNHIGNIRIRRQTRQQATQRFKPTRRGTDADNDEIIIGLAGAPLRLFGCRFSGRSWM